MKSTETANILASGIWAMTPVLIQLCGTRDHIVYSKTR